MAIADSSHRVSAWKGAGKTGALFFVVGLFELLWFLSAREKLFQKWEATAASESKQIKVASEELSRLREMSPAAGNAQGAIVETRRPRGDSGGRGIQSADLADLVSLGLSFQWTGFNGLDLTKGIDNMASIFGLAQNDIETLNQAAQAAARDTVAGVLTAAVVRGGENLVTIETSPSSTLRAPLVQMEQTFRTVLGEERYQEFVQLGAEKGVEDAFDKAILNPVKLTVSKIVDPATQQTEYRILRQEGTSVRSMSNIGSRSDLKSFTGQLDPLLPTAF